jgi:hypothetical protein
MYCFSIDVKSPIFDSKLHGRPFFQTSWPPLKQEGLFETPEDNV